MWAAVGMGKEKRETLRVKLSVNKTGGWLGQLSRGYMGWGRVVP